MLTKESELQKNVYPLSVFFRVLCVVGEHTHIHVRKYKIFPREDMVVASVEWLFGGRK